jgi:hypothetical protein
MRAIETPFLGAAPARGGAAPPPSRGPLGSYLRALPLAIAGWTAYAALMTQVFYFYLPLSGQGNPDWWGIFAWSLPVSWLWAVATPGIVALARRVPLASARRGRALAVHVGAAVALHVASALTQWVADPFLRPSDPQPLVLALINGTVLHLLSYGAIVAGVMAFDFRLLYERQRTDALQLRYELLEAQLHMIRLQLQPHFLFNALHAISELIYRDARLADRALTRLADLLRLSLASGVREEVRLEEELEFLDAYLDIERLRAGDALAVTFDIEPEALAQRVPNLLLQPLVENALRHGVRGAARGRVRVSARVRRAHLEIDVEDDGRGLPPGGTVEGLGLRSARARLRGLYGEDHALELEPIPAGGTAVRVRIPAARGDGARALAARAQEAG